MASTGPSYLSEKSISCTLVGSNRNGWKLAVTLWDAATQQNPTVELAIPTTTGLDVFTAFARHISDPEVWDYYDMARSLAEILGVEAAQNLTERKELAQQQVRKAELQLRRVTG